MLASARQKAHRAAELVDAIRALVEPLEAPNGVAILTEFDDRFEWVVALPEDTLQRAAILVGETAHAINSALDHVWFEIIGAPATWSPPFPLTDEDAQGEQRKGRGTDALHQFLRSDEFRGVRVHLQVTRRLDEIDKHRRLVVAATQQTSTTSTVFLGEPYRFDVGVTFGPLSSGAPLGTVWKEGLPRPLDELGIAFDFVVSLHEDDALLARLLPPGERIRPVPLLNAALSALHTVIESFERVSAER